MAEYTTSPLFIAEDYLDGGELTDTSQEASPQLEAQDEHQSEEWNQQRTFIISSEPPSPSISDTFLTDDQPQQPETVQFSQSASTPSCNSQDSAPTGGPDEGGSSSRNTTSPRSGLSSTDTKFPGTGSQSTLGTPREATPDDSHDGAHSTSSDDHFGGRSPEASEGGRGSSAAERQDSPPSGGTVYDGPLSLLFSPPSPSAVSASSAGRSQPQSARGLLTTQSSTPNRDANPPEPSPQSIAGTVSSTISSSSGASSVPQPRFLSDELAGHDMGSDDGKSGSLPGGESPSEHGVEREDRPEAGSQLPAPTSDSVGDNEPGEGHRLDEPSKEVPEESQGTPRTLAGGSVADAPESGALDARPDLSMASRRKRIPAPLFTAAQKSAPTPGRADSGRQAQSSSRGAAQSSAETELKKTKGSNSRSSSSTTTTATILSETTTGDKKRSSSPSSLTTASSASSELQPRRWTRKLQRQAPQARTLVPNLLATVAALVGLVWTVTEAMLHSKRLTDGYGPYLSGGYNGLQSVVIFGSWTEFLLFNFAVVYLGVQSISASLRG